MTTLFPSTMSMSRQPRGPPGPLTKGFKERAALAKQPLTWRARACKDSASMGNFTSFHKRSDVFTAISQSRSEAMIISQLRQDLKEAELREKAWREKAKEARSQLVQSMTEARVLEGKLESTKEKYELRLRQVKETSMTECLRCGSTSKPASVEALSRDLERVTLGSSSLSHGRESQLEGELKDAKEELEETKKKLRDARQQLRDVVELEEQREKKLRASNKFFDEEKIPMCSSEADVVQNMKDLNKGIAETARFLSGMIDCDPMNLEGLQREEFMKGEDFMTAYKRAGILGEDLVDDLVLKWINGRTSGEKINPWLVQTVMEFSLARWCADVVERWYKDWTRASFNSGLSETDDTQQNQHSVFSNPMEGTVKEKENQGLVFDLYKIICLHENQAVADRWAELSNTYLPLSTQGWDYSLISLIGAIMMVAGWDSRSKDFFNQLNVRLDLIFEPMIKLRKTASEVESADLALINVSRGNPFDPMFMEDSYAYRVDHDTTASKVAGMNGLGLQRLGQKKSEIGRGVRNWEILLKPKIVLERSILDEVEP